MPNVPADIGLLSCIGFVSNGEFNYLRTKGYTRPLSVLQARTNVRNKYKNYRKAAFLAMLTPKRKLQADLLQFLHC